MRNTGNNDLPKVVLHLAGSQVISESFAITNWVLSGLSAFLHYEQVRHIAKFRQHKGDHMQHTSSVIQFTMKLEIYISNDMTKSK